MAFRSDIVVFWHLSPRLIFVLDPSVELTVQDLHDTLQELSARPENMIYPLLIKSAGKEDLGGGVAVGITSTLQDAKIGFQARKVWTANGTVTTEDLLGTVLTDSAATFITDGVVPGAWIVNHTDESIATVNTVDTEISLTTDRLGDGYDGYFNVGDSYSIINTTQMKISGGNLVAVDGYGASIPAVFPTAGTQVIQANSSSATLQSQLQLEHSTFNGEVTVDAINGFSGTGYPIGTQQAPVNNIPDARAIALTRGFSTVKIIGDYTFDTGDDVSNITLVGESAGRSTLTFETGALTSNVEVDEATVTGTFDVQATFNFCDLIDIEFVEANIRNCVLLGTITLSGTGKTTIVNSSDGLTDDSPPPLIDFNGSGRSLGVRNYDGDLTLTNKTGPEDVEVNMSTGGRLTLTSSITNGEIRLTGVLDVIDNATGSAVVDTTGVIFAEQLQLAAFNGHIHIDVSNGTAGTKFPQGTLQNPVNNMADAISISAFRQIEDFLITNTLVVGASDVIDGYEFVGSNPLTSVVSLTSGCSTNRTVFKNMIVAGVVNGPVFFENVALQTLSNIGSDDFPSVFNQCIFRAGTHSLRAGLSTPDNIHFIECVSGIPGGGDGYAILDYNGTTSPVGIRRYSGGLSIRNYTGGQTGKIGFSEGFLSVESSCTSGTIELDGIVKLVNGSGGLTVNQRSNVHVDYIADTIWDELLADHIDTNTFGGWIGAKLLTFSKFLATK